MHRPPSRRQINLPDHVWKVPNFFNRRLVHHRPERRAEPGHDRADGFSELGEVLNVPLAGRL
jgi:hypothetical protein